MYKHAVVNFFIVASVTLQAVTWLVSAEHTVTNDKPVDYPQEEIDEYLKNNGLFHRSNELDDILNQENLIPENGDKTGCTTVVKHKSLNEITVKNRKYPVVQSRYWSQLIADVSCDINGDNKCMKDIFPFRYTATCETQKGHINVTVYDKDNKNLKEISVPVNIGCKCVLKDTQP